MTEVGRTFMVSFTFLLGVSCTVIAMKKELFWLWRIAFFVGAFLDFFNITRFILTAIEM